MSFPRYPAYKDSGVEWLGEVPEHWEVKRIASLYREVVEQGSDELPVLSVSIHHGVSDSELSEEEMDRKVTRSEDRSKYKRVTPGDLVYNMMRAWQGAFGTVCVEGMVSPAYVVARPTSNVPSNWIEYLLRTDPAISEIKRFSRGITDFRLRLYWDEFKNLRVCLPPSNERDVLLRLLDHETAKIDVLIAEQQRLIELLQEKRQTVISHAVTKGLNPDAPMKDSGVEWLGEVPEHWEVRPIKHLCDIYSGFPFKSDLFQGDGIPVVRMSNISGGCIDLQDAVCVPEHEVPAEAFIGTGDLLLGLSGSVGNFGIATEKDLPAAVNQRVALIRTSNPILKHFFGSSLFSDQVTCGLPSTTIANVSASQLGNCLLAVPPSDEQEKIEAFLLDFVSGSTELMSSIEASLSLLQERRSALISAAVTGQIDVRGLVPEASAA